MVRPPHDPHEGLEGFGEARGTRVNIIELFALRRTTPGGRYFK